MLFLLLLVLSFSNEKGIDWRNYVNEELNLRLLFINSNKIKLAMHECAIQEFNLKLFNIPFLMLFYRRFFTCNTWPKYLECIVCNHDTNLIMISYEILLIDKFWSSQEPIWYYNTNLQSALFLHILLSGLPSWDCGSTHWWFNSLWYWQYSPVKGSTFVGANRGYVQLHLNDLLR